MSSAFAFALQFWKRPCQLMGLDAEGASRILCVPGDVVKIRRSWLLPFSATLQIHPFADFYLFLALVCAQPWKFILLQFPTASATGACE